MRGSSSKTLCFRFALLVPIWILITVFVSPGFAAQDNASAGSDTLIFANGEKLIGHLVSATGGIAKFKSDTLGEVTIDLSKVQEFHSAKEYAVIKKGVKLGRRTTGSQIPQGAISVTDKNVEVAASNGQSAQTIATGDVGNIVDEAAFQGALHHASIFEHWKGTVVFGSSIVAATQNSLNFTTSASVVRTAPPEDWLDTRDRTILDFSDSYGKVSQTGVPTVKTSIFHADAERDEYFSPRVYAQATSAFDHNLSQGLNLQQVYGGGIGWTVIQKANQTLDLKGSIDYERQSFAIPAGDLNLAGSIFTQTYNLKFSKGILLKEEVSASPAWTNTRAYSGFASVGITLPVYKRFGFNAATIDSFLNNPPTGFKKNSFQFTTGLSYALP
jgi:hypothetical protein